MGILMLMFDTVRVEVRDYDFLVQIEVLFLGSLFNVQHF